MRDHSLEQPDDLAPLPGGQRFQEGGLCCVYPFVEPSEQRLAVGGEGDDVAAPILGIADTCDQAVAVQFGHQRMQIAAVDPQSPAELGLAGGTLLRERGQDREVLPPYTLLRQGFSDQSGAPAGELTGQPAREPPHSLRWVVREVRL